MHKNIKKMFLLTTLVFLLVGLNTITASDVNDNQTNTHFKQNTNNEINKLTANTPTIKSDNKNQITKTKQTTHKETEEQITTKLTIKFENNPEDEYSTEEYKTIHLNDEYTIDITLTEDENETPLPATIQLYLQEDTQPLNITLDQTGHSKLTYISQNIGNNLIYAEYLGNENYQPTTSDYITLSTEQYYPTLTINKIENTCYNSTITINGTLYNEETPMTNENIIISLNNNQITTIQTDNHGKYTYNYNLENIPIQEFAKITVEYKSQNEAIADANEQMLFDIEKIKNNIQINPIQNTQIYNNININGTVIDENNKNYAGTLTAIITNKNTRIEAYNNNILIENGQYSFNYTPNANGNYELTIKTQEDEYYCESIKTVDFIVDKNIPTLNLEDSYHSIVQENVTITGKLVNQKQHPLKNKTITITTQSETLGTTKTDNEGFFNFTEYIFHETVEDDYVTLYFDIAADEDTYELHTESKNYLSRRNVKITLTTDTQVKINGTLHIKGQVNDAYNESLKPDGTITVYIEDEKIKENIPINDGLYQSHINIQDKFIGKNTLNIETFFIPQNPRIYYAENYARTTTYQDLLDTALTIKTNDTRVDETTNIIISLQDENNVKLDKIITITITDDENQQIQNQTLQLTNGTVNTTFTPNREGIYHIITEYSGEADLYKETINEEEITVRKIDTNLKFYETTTTAYVNDTIEITGKLMDEDNNPIKDKNIIIIINSTTLNMEETLQTNHEGEYSYKFKPLTSQQYNITATFEETTKYNHNHINTTITPIKHDTMVTITNISTPIKYNDTISITGQVLDKEQNTPVNGSVTIILNNQIIDTQELINGKYTLNYQIKTTQYNEILVKFNNNSVYTESEEKTNFTTTPLSTTIVINPIKTTEINKTVTITGIVTDENSNNVNGKIRVKINNQILSEDISTTNGLFTLTYQTNNVGINTINITLTPLESYYYGTTNNTIFNVIRTNLQVANLEKQVNNKENIITITGQVTNNNNISTSNIQVKITCKDKTYNVTTDNDGTFTLTTDKLQPGEYELQLRIDQTEYFEEYEQDMGSILIDKYNTIINPKKIENATYSKNINITGNLTDNYNRPLKEQDMIITIGNNEYPTRTDNQGKYNIVVNNLQAGTYRLNITVPETTFTLEAKYNTTFTVNKDDARIVLETQEEITPGETLIIKGQLVNSDNHGLANKTVTVTINDRTYNVNTNNEGRFIYELPNIISGNYSIKVNFEDSNHNRTSTTTIIRAEKLKVQLVVDDIVARVGEYITFHARLTDQYGNKVNGGNLVFKVNGRTLRTDGRFDTNTPDVLKFNVKNGTVEYTLTADLYLRHGKNISASYSGSYRYMSTKSNTALASIQLRYANINVTTTVKKIKHHENITFIAKVNDITPNSDQNLLNNGTRVIFKINGVTIKDKQNQIIRTLVKNNTAILNYNISTMAGIDKNNNIRDYVVTAVYDNPNYYPVNNKNATTFNVERSPVNIDIREARVSGNSLSLKASLTDYRGYNIVGKSKVCVKINGITYKENNSTKYYTIKDGNLNINNINVDGMKVKRLEIVTGQRLAYLSARQTTTNIVY